MLLRFVCLLACLLACLLSEILCREPGGVR